MVDIFSQALVITSDRALGIGLPIGCSGETFKCGSVCINIEFLHNQLHELIVCAGRTRSVFPGRFEISFELSPQDFVRGCNVDNASRIDLSFECFSLSVDPILNEGSFNV
jgi:hypothetical protein